MNAVWTYEAAAILLGGIGTAIFVAVRWSDDRTEKALAKQEKTYAQDIADLKSEVQSLRERVVELERRLVDAAPLVTRAIALAAKMDHDELLDTLSNVQNVLHGVKPSRPNETQE